MEFQPTTSLSRRTLLGGGFAASGLLLIGASHDPASAAVDIAGCDTWGAAAAKEGVQMTAPLQHLLIHHTDTPNTTDYSRTRAFALARSIQQSHFGRGWIDSGQHLTVSRGGYVTEGRHRTLEGIRGGKQFALGAHCTNMNPTSFGIENEGNYMEVLPPSALWKKLVDTCAYVCTSYAVSPDIIAGHRDFLATDCPGDRLYAKLPALRSSVRTAMAARPWGRVRPGDTGSAVRAAQYLLGQAGRPVTVDGGYDSSMTTVVKAYQQAKGMFFIDGIIGPVSWESGLTPTLRAGSTAKLAVRALQTMLTARGQTVTVSGSFDSGTRAKVEAFQRSVGLGVDGVVGLDTWSRLLRA